MPNYDIIPLATDLLDYTIQRVKVKEPQYTKVKAYVMENGQMVEKELFEKIKDDGKPHFPKSQTFHMCADMQRMASAILQKCNSADGRYFETEYEERLKDLDEVIVLCDTLNQYINLSYKRKYISGDQCPTGQSWCARSVKRLSTGNAMTATVPPLCVRQRPTRSLPKWARWPSKLLRPWPATPERIYQPRAVIFGYDLFFHCAPRTRTTPTTPFT